MLGHGGIVVFDDSVDMARQARFAFEFCAKESCGKCTPCRIGSTRGVETVDKIIAGKLDKYYSTICLLEQTFVKDNTKTINDLLNSKIAELGENIVIRRFTRFQVGEALPGQTA